MSVSRRANQLVINSAKRGPSSTTRRSMRPPPTGEVDLRYSGHTNECAEFGGQNGPRKFVRNDPPVAAHSGRSWSAAARQHRRAWRDSTPSPTGFAENSVLPVDQTSRGSLVPDPRSRQLSGKDRWVIAGELPERDECRSDAVSKSLMLGSCTSACPAKSVRTGPGSTIVSPDPRVRLPSPAPQACLRRRTCSPRRSLPRQEWRDSFQGRDLDDVPRPFAAQMR